MKKELATHSSILAWETARTEEPGRLESTGPQSQIRLGDWTSTAANQVSILEMESSQHTPEFQNDYSSYILPV